MKSLEHNKLFTQLVKGEDICAVCGNPLPTESGRIICKECEEKANDTWRKNCGDKAQ